MQRIIFGCLLFVMMTMCMPVMCSILVKDGKSPYFIFVANDAAEPEKTAAAELQSYIKAITGAQLPVCDPQTATAGTPGIFVGPSEPVKRLLPKVAWDKLSPDAIVIKTVGNDLVLAGGRPRGTIYAVYTFLEDVAGVRWWTSKEEFVPKKTVLETGKLNIQYQPQFRYREVYYRDVVFDHGLFAVKLKTDGFDSNVPASHGACMTWAHSTFGHTFYQLLPPDVYAQQHPEWYSLIGGKRVPDGSFSQLCLTNEEMRKELTRVALEWIKNTPGCSLISISQNDSSRGACECDKCRALRDLEGSESGPLIHFVNAVASDIAKVYPNILVHTFAYSYTQTPPRHVKAAPNVMVQLCSMGCIADSPLNSEVNSKFRDDMNKWSKVASNLFIWDYVANFTNYDIPHPNLYAIGPNVRFFAKNNVTGAFEQGDSVTYSGDFVHLRAWVIAHLLWNPSLDAKKLIREFTNGYYGSAGKYILSYLELVDRAFKSKGYHIGCYNTEVSFLTLAQMNKAAQLFNDAEKSVENDPVLLARVKRDRLSFDHLWLLRYSWLKREADLTKTPFLGPADPVQACEQFIAGINHYSPGQYLDTAPNTVNLRNLALSAKTTTPAAKAPAECANIDPAKWLDLQEDQSSILYSADIIDDPQASNSRAIKINGNIIDWVVRYQITGDIADAFPEAHCYVSVRCDTVSKNPDDPAFSIGLYDEGKRAFVSDKQFKIGQLKGDGYQVFDIGTYKLSGNSFFWIVAPGNLEKVRSVNVDRIFMIKKEK